MTYDKQKIQEEFRKMKATGIVRRIDDLGRVVIPKEIRKTLRIKDHSEKIFAHWRAEYVCCGICGSIGADHRTDCLYYRS